jgi:hypothetical protein
MKKTLQLAAAVAVASSIFVTSFANAQTTSVNTGSLGAAGNGTNTAGVIFNLPSPIVADGNTAVGYSGGERTTVPFNTALNPTVSVPFSIEFWARPTAADGDDTPLSNRFATGDRSGWTFFQRPAAEGWNFRMYNGVGGGLGWDLTGGTATLDSWSHVVATWNGSVALLYVNGVLADNTNAATATGVYNPNTAANSPVLSIAANFDGGSASTTSMDEVAFYASALTPTQIANHFAAASNPTAGFYSSMVVADGAVLYLQNIPEPATGGFLAVCGAIFLARRRR